MLDLNHGVATGTVAESDVDNPPVHCLPYDGFRGSMPGPDVLYGVGGCISGITGASIDFIRLMLLLGLYLRNYRKNTGDH